MRDCEWPEPECSCADAALKGVEPSTSHAVMMGGRGQAPTASLFSPFRMLPGLREKSDVASPLSSLCGLLLFLRCELCLSGFFSCFIWPEDGAGCFTSRLLHYIAVLFRLSTICERFLR